MHFEIKTHAIVSRNGPAVAPCPTQDEKQPSVHDIPVWYGYEILRNVGNFEIILVEENLGVRCKTRALDATCRTLSINHILKDKSNRIHVSYIEQLYVYVLTYVQCINSPTQYLWELGHLYHYDKVPILRMHGNTPDKNNIRGGYFHLAPLIHGFRC